MAKKKKGPGRTSLFRGKRRAPVSLTLTPAHHRKVNKRVDELDVTRADLIGLLIEKHSDTVTISYPDAYKRLRNAVEALGGTLEHQKRNEPRGGTWVLTLGGKRLPMESKQAKQYRLLDDCYKLKEGVTKSSTWEDHDHEKINPAGLAELFRQLAAGHDLGTE